MFYQINFQIKIWWSVFIGSALKLYQPDCNHTLVKVHYLKLLPTPTDLSNYKQSEIAKSVCWTSIVICWWRARKNKNFPFIYRSLRQKIAIEVRVLLHFSVSTSDAFYLCGLLNEILIWLCSSIEHHHFAILVWWQARQTAKIEWHKEAFFPSRRHAMVPTTWKYISW